MGINTKIKINEKKYYFSRTWNSDQIVSKILNAT